MIKYNYYNKNDHLILFYFVRKIYESNNNVYYCSSHFYKECRKNKMRYIFSWKFRGKMQSTNQKD